ncbi:MAG: ADP-heptose:LPS heptosyltransferase [Alphaproteobacteria bacterium]|jgi:heptosyltransferase-3
MRILFVTANRIGDAVLSTGLLSHLIEQYPDARFTVAAGPASAPLFADMPRLDRIIIMRKRPFSTHWLYLWLACVTRKWGIVLDLRRSALGYTLYASERFIAAKSTSSAHRVRQLATTLGLSDNPPAPKLWIGADAEKTARALIPGDAPVLAIAPAANWPGKQWRPEYFAELVERLTGPTGALKGAKVAVFAAAHERAQIKTLLDAIPDERQIDLVGRTGLTAAIACLRRCTLFIGNDSGLMHMAAAAGAPTLGLFGPSRDEHYAPWGPKAALVRTVESYDELVGAPGYDHKTTGTLMDGLSVDAAEDAAIKLWRRISVAS